MIRRLVPYGLQRALDWKVRFQDMGLGELAAWRAAASRSMRQALLMSRIEYLPPALRTQLSLVVDVGANVGQWISAFLKFVIVERAEVFEPNPHVFTDLKACLRDRPGVHLHNIAVGDQPGDLTLHVTHESTSSSLLPASDMRAKWCGPDAGIVSEIPVPVMPLDSMIPAGSVVDLLKVDVEGFERQVLTGGLETLKRTRAVLIEMHFESHWQGDAPFGIIYNLLIGDLGFRFWDMSPLEREPRRGGRALWADVAFVNPSMEPTGAWRKE